MGSVSLFIHLHFICLCICTCFVALPSFICAFGKKPSVAHMRVFGCIAYAKIPDASRTKLEPKSVKCLLLGYCEGTKAYKLICLESKKIIRCCDVIFCEHGELQKELELGPSGSNMDKQVVILDTPPTSIDGEQIDREDESDGED